MAALQNGQQPCTFASPAGSQIDRSTRGNFQNPIGQIVIVNRPRENQASDHTSESRDRVLPTSQTVTARHLFGEMLEPTSFTMARPV